ncbi:DNA-directed DNA polymerase delta subunit POL31 KNAG_0B05030 [Huiozyma naganishii CBS 8797]|uniref:DNA-directed DNA polymerase n=1 Tax=Huiozyma naganishii (strain ATCC MYA-139 / BCRC 22969 / CBS 8797 / KCTC 17520 / NBRC 10181 / NCYC 3082 / Yp74L-3) TaxID=1071383 RepID=J7RVH8_HUIN7|nr:hypothetical protein KNAG_0B05030 [Kazachstania naganishii CBS 8797]CCK68937.1 hypothetical protein KNAG_0B05030 [Kazachstania naganishii CBS 8797]
MDALLEKFNAERPGDAPEPVKRHQVDANFDQPNPFDLKWADRDYSSQFYHMYQYRLNVLRERVVKECKDKWDNGFKLNGRLVVQKEKVLDIQGREPCWCVGTIYCEMKYKPNILEEVVNDTYGVPDLVKSYTDPQGEDEIMLEDESGRVILVGEYIRTTPFITGTVVGILGMEADPGTFQVLDICYPSALPQIPLPHPVSEDRKIALVSGLNINTTQPTRITRLKMLQEYLTGYLDKTEYVSEISRLIVCGNSVEFQTDDAERGKLTKCLEEFGTFLRNVLPSIPVDVMPGANDPSDKSLPQQPLHTALFDESMRPYFSAENRQLLNLMTNPCSFSLNGWDVLAMSGQSINDICKYIIPYTKEGSDPNSEASSETMPTDTTEHRLDLMECTMKWQNIAPTAPDTLWCYPYKNDDPFILKRWPHVYCVGNQPEFGSRVITMNNGAKIKMIAIPEFSTTGKIVLLNLKSLDTEVVRIDI